MMLQDVWLSYMTGVTTGARQAFIKHQFAGTNYHTTQFQSISHTATAS
jgi:hypothetical protein